MSIDKELITNKNTEEADDFAKKQKEEKQGDNKKEGKDEDKLEQAIGEEVYKFALEEIQVFYNEVRDNADWTDVDDMEKEEILANLTDDFIKDLIEMIDWDNAQKHLTKKEKRELFKKSFFTK
jgi:hypothetical protein